MRIRTLLYRLLSVMTLLAVLLSLSPAPSLLAYVEEGLANTKADTSAPAAVVNLVASTGTSPGTVELSWVAPGDDATAGTASAASASKCAKSRDW